MLVEHSVGSITNNAWNPPLAVHSWHVATKPLWWWGGWTHWIVFITSLYIYRYIDIIYIYICKLYIWKDIKIADIIMKDYFQAMYFDFLNFSDRFTSTKMPDQWTIVKICINKTIYNLLFFQVFPIYFRSSKAFNCIAALKHKFDMCCSNRRRWSIVIPTSFTDLVASMSLFSIASLHLASYSFLL